MYAKKARAEAAKISLFPSGGDSKVIHIPTVGEGDIDDKKQTSRFNNSENDIDYGRASDTSCIYSKEK